VAVRTDDLAAFDLAADERPTSRRRADSPPHLEPLLHARKMIEIKHDGIRLPAIDAGIVREVRHEPNEVALAMGGLEGRQVGWIGDGHAPLLLRTSDDASWRSRIHKHVI
jgi:hypothetical protein